MYFNNFSEKQLKVLSWWMPDSPYKDCDAIICDGAVRSGKTMCLSLSFVLWSMEKFQNEQFAICGKSKRSCERNVIYPLLRMINEALPGYTAKYSQQKAELVINHANKSNLYFIYGGKDEGSAALIQGVTLAGLLLDEVVLMPKSFVNQAILRCSVEGAKLWLGCNPEGPNHWFYLDWILDETKNAYRVHFQMQDNNSLSPKTIERYYRMHKGTDFSRFVLGEWVKAEGLVYPQFGNHLVFSWNDDNIDIRDFERDRTGRYDGRWIVSIDYGTRNPFSAGLWFYGNLERLERKIQGVIGYDGRKPENNKCAYRVKEYYHNSKEKGNQLTDEEYYNALENLIGDKPVEEIWCDPSAASFRELIYRKGKYTCYGAKNNVQDGIRHTATALNTGSIKIHESCVDTIREFSLYTWDDKALDDRPIKENDHAMDDIRYFCENFLAHEKYWD